MKTIMQIAKAAKRILTSRGFSLSVMAIVLSLSVYAVTANTYTVYLMVDGENKVINTSNTQVGAILKECEVDVDDHDVVEFSGFDGNTAEIRITRSFPVAIRVDDTTYTLKMTGGTVADALAAAGVQMGEDDLISSPLYSFLEEGQRIHINRIDYQTSVYQEMIPYEQEVKTTPLLKTGRTRLLQAGETGEKLLTYGETTKDGYVEEKELLGENIVAKPVTQIHLVGGNVPVSPYDFGYSIVNNAPTQYKMVITNARATGYSAGPRAKGASGNKLSAGHVAVNPNVIPYGSKLYITSADGNFVYGYAIASDTGTGLLQGIIDVDLYYDTYLESVLNGLRNVNIYVLE